MAIEYALVLAGATPVEQVAERAAPQLGDRPTGTAPVLFADLAGRFGFALTIRAGRSRYVSVRGDSGWWEWEPEPSVSLTFRMDKLADVEWQVANMLLVVRRVLDTGVEDAAFFLNGDLLLLTRLGGQLTKHHRADWWANYAGADEVVPG